MDNLKNIKGSRAIIILRNCHAHNNKHEAKNNDFAFDLIEHHNYYQEYNIIIKGRKSVELSVTVVWE